MLINPKPITFEEFMDIDKKSEERLEFINGRVFCQAAPSILHQRVIGRLFNSVSKYFDKTGCEPFLSPIDIILQNEEEKNKVQPDIVIICDKNGFTENNYVGIPALVIEVLSPSTASRDYIEKMNIYMRFGVKEYWIVSPKNKEIQIFILQDGAYIEPVSYKDTGIAKSILFEGLNINIEEIYS